MRTQKRTFLGIDITRHKPLYAEIDALTEENREQAAEIGKLREKIDEQKNTIGAQKSKIDLLNSDNSGYYQTIESQKREIATFKAKATDFEDKYNAAVKYQQNTQAAYDELKADYESTVAAHNKFEADYSRLVSAYDKLETENDKAKAAYKEMKAEYDRFLARIKRGYTEDENKNKVAEADAVPTGCETAKTIGAKAAQSRGKNGRFEKKHKRADDPRK